MSISEITNGWAPKIVEWGAVVVVSLSIFYASIVNTMSTVADMKPKVSMLSESNSAVNARLDNIEKSLERIEGKLDKR